MKFTYQVLSVAISIALLTGCNKAPEQAANPTAPAATVAAAPAAAQTESEKANAFFDQYFDSATALSPMALTQLGLKKDYDKWDQLTDEQHEKELALTTKTLADLAQFDVSKLDAQTALSYQLFKQQLEQDLANDKWRYYNYPVNQMFGMHTSVPALLINQHQIADETDAKAYIARLNGIPQLFKQHEHDARMRGLPIAGSGVIFNVPNDSIVIEPFEIPSYWPQIIGMDFGWRHPTAAIACAYDPDADIFYLIGEHCESQMLPAEHAPYIKSLNRWANIAWPSDAINTDKTSGMNLAEMYRDEGLNMLPEHATFENGSRSVEAGVQMMLQRMKQGRFKVFRTCEKWIAEKQQYSRKDGVIVGIDDDCIDASRYAMMCLRYATTKPVYATSTKTAVSNKAI